VSCDGHAGCESSRQVHQAAGNAYCNTSVAMTPTVSSSGLSTTPARTMLNSSERFDLINGDTANVTAVG